MPPTSRQSLASRKSATRLSLLIATLAFVGIPSFTSLVNAVEPKPKYDPEVRWKDAIAKFEQQDRQQPPQAGGIVFVGSSSIRLWPTDKAFPDWNVVNRGFGGSQISDVVHFFDRLVGVHQPNTIVFYAGDNDIAAGESVQEVAGDFKKFLKQVTALSPETNVIYVPIKPSLARWQLWPEMAEANARIRKQLDQRENWHYADIATPMLGKDGKPRPELFAKDGLHLNEQGYEVWETVVRPLIAKTLR